MPLLSDNWTSHFKWRGEGPFPAEERKRLAEAVEQAHRHGRRVRFWGTPEQPELWRELRAAKVDLLGTDQLAELHRFLEQESGGK